MKPYTFAALFCGLGGSSKGFIDAGWDCVGAFDSDRSACLDHAYLTGHPAHCVDLQTIEPHEIAAMCDGRPDVMFTSPPCKGFSACQPEHRSRSTKYQAMNSLAERGVWLALEAWLEPPPIILLENVPRVTTRGRKWLDNIQAMLRAYGYACAETRHDCGVWGGLAQHRDRVLLVARHMEQVPTFLEEPPARRVRGIGEVFDKLPVPLPGGNEGGPMHTLPKLAAINWVRLALIRAGHDWRDIPKSVELVERSGRHNGGFGVNDWDEGSHTVVSEGSVRNTWASVADPRLTCAPRSTVYGVADAGGASGTVVAAARHDNGMYSVADPRVDCVRREGGHGVKRWSDASTPIISHPQIHNFPAAVADPRLDHATRPGTLGVRDWAQASHTVIAASTSYHGQNIADPRVPVIVGPRLDISDKSPTHIVIESADGTWHRPMTTLELAALQGFPVIHSGDWLRFCGKSHGGWRQRIGNAVPPPTAEAIANAMADVLNAAAAGSTFKLASGPVWVDAPKIQGAA